MGKPGDTGITRIIKAAGYSSKGMIAAFKHEAAFRQEVLLACVLIPLAFWLGDNSLQVLLLITPVFLVLIVELLNSGLEALVDRVGLEHHELSGRAKDMGSAAVLLSLILVLITWVSVLFFI